MATKPEPLSTAPVDHAASGLARLPQQYRDDPQTAVQKLVAALLSECAPLEAAQQQLLRDCTVDNATGKTLTVIGEFVGRPRNGVSDDEAYRRLVRAQIAANDSDGLIEQLIAIASLVIYDPAARYVVNNIGAATVELKVEGLVVSDALAEVTAQILRRAVDAGVRLVLHSSPALAADAFSFGHIPASMLVIGDGLGDSTEPGHPVLTPYTNVATTGGRLVDAR